ncbi:histone deacetylase family protein [Pseudotabrizicola algicola]|uniref:Histone deacetylase family protein n=1 Tax=Pseudotabrizicola algicola TaxID=2709381 RepID=A0A6B3RPH3_9RHOB|nr:histone deacetylase family protein [Pseudotabrizicola algicola]NEX48000.1 histone deacetylase family protein [Pseudotabrizicola algicola]
MTDGRRVLVLTHDDCLSHVTPPGHPEQVARLQAVERGLQGLAVERRAAPTGAVEDVLRCHPHRHVDRLRAAVPAQGWAQVDGDTFLSPGSYTAAMRGVGGICAAVDHVMTAGGRAFVATRPPGHHAERETAMGFCLFGTVAIGAMRALEVHGLNRVAVLDFDVHHGNGTQDLLWDEPRVRFVSSQQMPLYPGSGHPDERGAHGQITNLPLPAGSGGAQMWAAWEPALAALRLWQPELVMISAGFDAHRDDPLAGLMWSAADFARLTRAICALADECCAGRVVSALEGGYDLDALADCVAAHVKELGRQAA